MKHSKCTGRRQCWIANSMSPRLINYLICVMPSLNRGAVIDKPRTTPLSICHFIRASLAGHQAIPTTSFVSMPLHGKMATSGI